MRIYWQCLTYHSLCTGRPSTKSNFTNGQTCMETWSGDVRSLFRRFPTRLLLWSTLCVLGMMHLPRKPRLWSLTRNRTRVALHAAQGPGRTIYRLPRRTHEHEWNQLQSWESSAEQDEMTLRSLSHLVYLVDLLVWSLELRLRHLANSSTVPTLFSPQAV